MQTSLAYEISAPILRPTKDGYSECATDVEKHRLTMLMVPRRVRTMYMEVFCGRRLAVGRCSNTRLLLLTSRFWVVSST